MQTRPAPKKLERFQEKVKTAASYNWSRAGAFKCINDFYAIRVKCQHDEINSTVKQILVTLKDVAGACYVRTADKVYEPAEFDTIELPPCDDIICYVCLHLPGAGIVEMQIGEGFAHKTFKRDTLLRDLRSKGEPVPETPEYFDYWDDDLYMNVRGKLLAGDREAARSLIREFFEKRGCEPDAELLEAI